MGKTHTPVTLLGKPYNLVGSEDEAYLQRVATYINGKQAELKKTQGYFRQNADFRNLMLILNLADDYFKALNRVRELEERNEDLERDIYSLKHDLVSRQMRYEGRDDHD